MEALRASGASWPEQCRQVTGQYQHALVMDRAGELDLALDVDHALVACKGARRHAHRKSEAGVAQVDLRQGVDLAHPAALQRDQPVALGHRFAQPLGHGIVARGARGQRGLHLGHTDQPRMAQGGALGDQRLGAREDGTLAGLVVGFAVRLLHQTRHRSR
jgi:hypothetical protein